MSELVKRYHEECVNLYKEAQNSILERKVEMLEELVLNLISEKEEKENE